MLLWSLASGSVFFLGFVFFWLLASAVTGDRSMNPVVGVTSTVFAVAFFYVGRRHLQKHGPQDWSRVAQAPTRTPGMRIFGRKNFEYGQAGIGIATLLLAGPEWLEKAREEWRSRVPATKEMAEQLERLRRNLAARDSWSPVQDFSTHREELYLLATLEIVAIRESLGQWFFHVTLEGSARFGLGATSSGVEEQAEVEVEIEG